LSNQCKQATNDFKPNAIPANHRRRSKFDLKKIVKQASTDSTVMGVTISHPDKQLWPAFGGQKAVSKLDLAEVDNALAGMPVTPELLSQVEALPPATDTPGTDTAKLEYGFIYTECAYVVDSLYGF